MEIGEFKGNKTINKISVEIGEFKGNKTITLYGDTGGKYDRFTFGIRKAQMIVDNFDAIKKFSNQFGGEKKKFKKAAKESEDE